MGSIDLSLLDVPMARRAHKVDVDMALVRKQPSKSRAISLCISLSGFEDKPLYRALGIDSGHWTRIKQGKAHLPPDAESALMRMCGNHVPLMWSAWNEGFELRPITTLVEAENVVLKTKLDEKDREIATLHGLLRSKK